MIPPPGQAPQAVAPGAGCEVGVGQGALAHHEHRRGRVGDLAADRGGEAAALHQRGQGSDLVPVRFPRALVSRHSGERNDLAVEPVLGLCPQRPLVGLDRERLHLVTGDVPLLGDELGAAELTHFLGAVTVGPTGRAGERVGEPELLSGGHRRGDRDLAHVLHAAGDDDVGRAAHDGLRGEVDRLLARSALTVDRRAGDLLGQSGGEPARSGDVTGLRADRVHAAEHDVFDSRGVVAGGVQNMSQIPIAAAMTSAEQFGFTDPFSGSTGWTDRYGTQEVSQFRGAELIAEKWNVTRDEMEAFAVESHERALRAQAEDRFDREIVPLAGVTRDEGPREPNWDKIRSLPPLVEGGRLTAAVSSQISDASAAMLVVSERALADHDLTPRARIHHLSVRGADPIFMLSAPIPATAYALERTGMSLDDIDLVEINEAFASVVLAWQRETGADLQKVNVNGGAIALGHPLGATGVRLMTTLLNELERTGGRYGLQTMCEGGGQANVTILERLG